MLTDKKKLEKLKKLGEKYSEATEYFDSLIMNDFVELPFMAKKFIYQIAEEILEITNE